MRKWACFAMFFIATLFTSQLTAQVRKTVYIVVDGIPADYIERVRPKTIFEVANTGNYSRATTGGEIGCYSQTPTISAIGYMNILTGTWMNKHNVNGNSNLNPNYNYWSIFRVAKEQTQNYTTALFSSWIDNRTVLLGENKPENGNLKIDYVYDGYELDTINFPVKKLNLHIFDIDSKVAMEASHSIRNNAPDLSWVYLWYTDDGFHSKGDGQFMDDYVRKTDNLLAPIWEAVKYREKHFNEEWLFIITTDHGRTENGHSHGGQSERERSVWVACNQKKVNKQFDESSLSLVDIHPTIANYMGFETPQEVYFEQDGTSFIGKREIYNLKTTPFDNHVTLSWQSEKPKTPVTIYMATDNEFAQGGKDEWIKVATTKEQSYAIDLSKYPKSKLYKFVVEAPNNKVTRWLKKRG